MKIQAQKLPWSRGIDLAILQPRIGDIPPAYASNLVMQTFAEGDMINPVCSFSMAEAQELIDSLWDCGLRPSEGSGSAGQLAATQKHLEDMRTLVFKTK